MICKRGNKDCQMIGCDCYRTAPIEEIDAELEAAGINLSDLEKRTKTVVRLSMELCNRDAEIERLKAKLEESERALDEATEGMSITQDAVFMPIRIQRNGVTICQAGERPALAAYLLSGHGVK